MIREIILRTPKGRESQGMAKETCNCADDGTQRETGSYGRAQRGKQRPGNWVDRW